MELLKTGQKLSIFFQKEDNLVEMSCTISAVMDDRIVIELPKYFMRYIEYLDVGCKLTVKVFSKIGKGLLSGFRHHIAGAVALLFFLDQPAVQQFVDGLLDVEIRGVVVVQKKAGDLCVGEGEIHPLQHIENDHFIQCGCLFNHE